MERFYLHQKKTDMDQIIAEFEGLLQQGILPDEAIEKIETSHKVIIVEIDNISASENDKVNEQIRSAFQEKGIGFQKYWFWEEDYKRVLNGEQKIKLYQQDKLDYSLLINYVKHSSSIYAITMIVPNVADAFHIVNIFLIAVNIVTVIFTIAIIVFLISRITKPLHLFEQFAQKMKNNEFIPIEVDTKDELEDVADSLNLMGTQIQVFQQSLQEKNLQMEQLLENVAHDLKTPISLIQLYANGIKDGVDDGTFLETIIEESGQMAAMVNRLFYLSRIEKDQFDPSEVDLSNLLNDLVSKYHVLAEEKRMEIHLESDDGLSILGNEELLQSMFLNLITNAIKYSVGKEICLNLFKQTDNVVFSISNEMDNASLDINKIWNPYYVGDTSRNKNLSGTGLGLSIVRKICETQKYFINCSIKGNLIIFTVMIPL